MWFQADLNLDGILAGVNMGIIDADSADNDEGFSAMLGYEMKDTMTIKVAISSIDDKGTILGNIGNIATNNHQSKLYTGMWWSSGYVSATGTDTVALSVDGTVGDGIDLFTGFYFAERDFTGTDTEFTEIVATVSKSFGPLDTSLALIYDDIQDNLNATNDVQTTHLQFYLTYNF